MRKIIPQMALALACFVLLTGCTNLIEPAKLNDDLTAPVIAPPMPDWKSMPKAEQEAALSVYLPGLYGAYAANVRKLEAIKDLQHD